MIRGFRALSGAKKVLWGLGIFLAPLFIISAVSPTPDMQKTAQVNRATDTPVIAPETTEAPTPEPQAMKSEIKVVNETVVLPYQSSTREDSSLEAGKTIVAVTGVDGEKTVTFSVTYTNGVETGRSQVSETVTKPPVNEVKKIGTKTKSPQVSPKPSAVSNKCDHNYTGACVPIASDVDCAGGSGNGPAFVLGPVRVIGLDIYKLDRDGNGIGCE